MGIAEKIISKVKQNADWIGVAYGFGYPMGIMAQSSGRDLFSEIFVQVSQALKKMDFNRLSTYWWRSMTSGRGGVDVVKNGGIAIIASMILKEMDVKFPKVGAIDQPLSKFGWSSIVLAAVSEAIILLGSEGEPLPGERAGEERRALSHVIGYEY